MAGVSLDSLCSASGLDAGRETDRNDGVGLGQLYERQNPRVVRKATSDSE